MKKRIFKDWISYSLCVIQVCLFVLVGGECTCDAKTEFMIKAPMVCVMIINHILIARHTEFYTNGF